MLFVTDVTPLTPFAKATALSASVFDLALPLNVTTPL